MLKETNTPTRPRIEPGSPDPESDALTIRPVRPRGVMRKPFFAYAKTKTQISFAVTAKLISAFVFATQIIQSLYFLHPKFQACRHLLWLYSPVYVRPGRKPRRPVFSERGSYHWYYSNTGHHWLPENIQGSLVTIFQTYKPYCRLL